MSALKISGQKKFKSKNFFGPKKFGGGEGVKTVGPSFGFLLCLAPSKKFSVGGGGGPQ